jgi:uncharacterized protein YuzE
MEAGIKLTKSKVTQKIDLEDLIGVDISEDRNLVREIGQAIIDYMVERAEDGKGLNGVKLKSPYSKEYSESLDFKAAGKSKSKVNMTLSGDMLASIDIVDQSGSVIEIGIEDSEQAVKAYGHQTGFEGHPVLDGPKRPFFGVSVKELQKEILPQFKNKIKNASASGDDQELVISRARSATTAAELFNIENYNDD